MNNLRPNKARQSDYNFQLNLLYSKTINIIVNKLCDKGETITARMYECYRAKRELQRQENALDEAEAGIVDGYNKEERDIVNYFVIKNTLDDPIVFTHLSTDEIDIFTKTLTKADPQAGLLFSLSYNTNK